MYRSKKILFTAHCVLNQNAVIRDWERAAGAFNDIVRLLLDRNISIIQLPCPEFTFLGETRPPKTKEEYDIRKYRKLCAQLAASTVAQIKEYITYNYEIIGLLGIAESPSCDTLGSKGIFMEELYKKLKGEQLNLPSFDIPEEYIEGKSKATIKDLKAFLAKKTRLM